MITVATTMMMPIQSGTALTPEDQKESGRRVPRATTGGNVYVARLSSKTGNDEVIFRAATDNGETFGDKINLINTPNADSTRIGIDSGANSLVVISWETNETSDTPVKKISTDNGKRFGLLLSCQLMGRLLAMLEDRTFYLPSTQIKRKSFR